ncbi:MAG: phosphate ABC transporter permease subunit PstC [Bdellovibrionales bacterium]|nr:phosphate ABC transporter permease subunit PstC [Bdellovibrionales bacterium]
MVTELVEKLFFTREISEEISLPLKKRDVHFGDKVFYYLLKGASWGIVFLLLAMVGLILKMSWPAFSTLGWTFFTSAEWNSWTQEFGVLSFIYGTVISSLLAVAFAVPVSVGVALFLNELAPSWLARPLGFLIEMLAAIPSIVYGLWGLFVLAPLLRTYVQPVLLDYFGWFPLFQGPPLGVGMLCAGVLLAIMITPTISAMTREVFKAIPVSHREAALGLGATRWEMLKLAVLKTGTSGIIGAVILGLGRALGETMAVTMVIGNKSEIHLSLFESGQTMASILANQYAEADSDLQLAALTAVGLTLFMVSLIINSIARFIVWKVEKGFKGGK